MMTNIAVPTFFLLMASLATSPSQGTFIYDQQSATNGIGANGSRISNQPIGQSFTPASAWVGFVQLQFGDFSGGSGATVSVRLLENSITGNVLATSSLAAIPNGFVGIATFVFPSNIPVVSGTEYFFNPILQNGDDIALLSDVYGYGRGVAYFSGQASVADLDLWFREGYFVPEPAATSLGLLGTLAIFVFRRKALG